VVGPDSRARATGNATRAERAGPEPLMPDRIGPLRRGVIGGGVGRRDGAASADVGRGAVMISAIQRCDGHRAVAVGFGWSGKSSNRS
jgi:hypothetical protein